MAFTLTTDEVTALESFKSHCEYTEKYIDRLLYNNTNGDADCDELEWIYADNARGLVLQADWSTMHGEIRVIQDMEKRYAEYKDKEESK